MSNDHGNAGTIKLYFVYIFGIKKLQLMRVDVSEYDTLMSVSAKNNDS